MALLKGALSAGFRFLLGRSVSGVRLVRRVERAFSSPAHRNHDEHADDQAHVVPLRRVCGDAGADGNDSHAEENECFEQETRLLRTRSRDCRRWTFWHDVFCRLWLRDRGLSPPVAACRA